MTLFARQSALTWVRRDSAWNPTSARQRAQVARLLRHIGRLHFPPGRASSEVETRACPSAVALGFEAAARRLADRARAIETPRWAYTWAGGSMGAMVPSASLCWYSRQLMFGSSGGLSTIEMQSVTGHTSEHMLQPTHVPWLIVYSLT